MSFTTATVHSLVERAVLGQFDIPEFQRDFVWRPDQVKSLVDSLYHDYPIGQILTWESPEGAGSRTAADTQGQKLWLVDGQQRTTALCFVFGRKPYWWNDAESWNRRLAGSNVLANVCTAANAAEFGLANPVRSADPKWVPVREIVAIEFPVGSPELEAEFARRAEEIFRKLPGKLSSKFPAEAIRERLRAIWQIRAREVAVADVHHEIEEVAEIFTRLNQQGTAVTEADVSLAVAATLHPGWVRDEFLPFLKNLSESGYDLEPGVVIRVLTALGEGKVRLGEVSREFWKSDGFSEAWAKTRASLSAVVSGLAGSGLLSSLIIPSQNALVPLAILHEQHGSRGFHFPRALHWFLMANRDGRYSGSALTTLAEDVRAIREAEDFPEAIQSLRGKLEMEFRLSPEDFLERDTWNRPLLLILYLTLFARSATDWTSRRRLGYSRADGALDYGFVPNWHSFFPRGRTVLRSPKFDFSEDEVGAIANVVVLNDKPKDRRWVSSPPSKYLPASGVRAADLSLQLVPVEQELWEPERYRDFLSERARLLAEACNDYLAGLVGSAR